MTDTKTKWSWTDFYQTRGNSILSLVKGMVGAKSDDGKRIVVQAGGKTSVVDTGSTRTLTVKIPDHSATGEAYAQDRRRAYVAAVNAKEGVKSYDIESDDVTKNMATVLDGGRMRMDIIEDYPGDKYLFGTEAEDIALQMDQSDMNPSQKLTNMLALAGVTSTDIESFSRMAEVMNNDPEVADLWDKADKKGLVSDAMRMRTPEDAHNLARKLKQFVEEERPQDMEGMGDSDGSGNGDEEGEAGDGESKKSGKGGAPGGPDKWMLTDGNEPFYTEPPPPKTGSTEMDVMYQDYVNKNFAEGGGIGTRSGYATSIMKYADSAKTLADDLRTLLQVRSQARYQKNQTKGKLSRTSVWKVAVPTVGSGKWNSQIFRKKQVNDCLDTAVTLLVDCSGSMAGQKYQVACAAAIVMSQALDVLGVPYEVVGFTTSYNGASYREVAMLAIFKQFGVPNVPSTMLSAMDDMAGRLRNNPDGPAVQFATNRLCATRNKRRVMITLSDGYPATSVLDDYSALIKAVQEAREANVEVYAIGIFSDAVKTFYGKDSVVINNLDNNRLAEVLLEVLSNKLI